MSPLPGTNRTQPKIILLGAFLLQVAAQKYSIIADASRELPTGKARIVAST